MAAFVGLAFGPLATGHELDGTTAQVTLRDGHVVVRAHVDFMQHMEASDGPSEVPLGLLAVVDPEAFVQIARSAGQSFQQGTVLTVNGEPVVVQGWHLPDPVQLQADAQRAWLAQTVGDHGHTALSQIAFEARLTVQPESVSVSLPQTVGPVLVSFVQPVGQVAAPGTPVRLDVRSWTTSAAAPLEP